MKMEPRNIRTSFVAAGLVLGLLPAIAGATVLTQDSFNYPNGNLTGVGGWQTHSGGGTKLVQVNGNTIRIQQTTGGGEDVNKRWFTPASLTQPTFSGFNLKMESGSVVGVADYFAHWRPGIPDTIGFVGRLFVSTGTNASQYVLSISDGSVPAQGVAVPWTSELLIGVTYKVVTSYDPVTGASVLWVNPTSPSSPSVTPGPNAATANKALESYAFRQATGPAGHTSFQIINDMAVATTFAEVIGPGAKGAPSLNEWGMMLLSAALLIAGGMFVVRRRATVA